MGRLANFSRVKDHGEVCPLSRPVMLPICRYVWRNRYLLDYREAFAFSLMSYPHRHRSTSQWTFPLQGAIRTYPVPLERRDRLGPFSTPAVWFAHGGGSRNPRTHCKKEPLSILGSLVLTALMNICVFCPCYQA